MLDVVSTALFNPIQARADLRLFRIDHSSTRHNCDLRPSSGPRDQRPSAGRCALPVSPNHVTERRISKGCEAYIGEFHSSG